MPGVRLGLSRELWIVQIGVFINALGWGAVLPFEIIYLHNGRGFSLGVAGAVVGVLTGLAVVGAPLAGPMIDRVGARATCVAGSVALALGYGGLAAAHRPSVAFAAAALAGLGNGAANPSQSALLAALAPARLRHRATAVSRVFTNVGFGLGGGIGGLVAGRDLNGLIALLLANAASYVVFAVVLIVVVGREPRVERLPGGYRHVLRDRAFLWLAAINVVVIGVGWGFFSWVVPPYARDSLGMSTTRIGLLLLANSFAVALLQIPIARALEGHRRTTAITTGAGIFAVSFVVLTVADGVGADAAYTLLLLASIAIGAGECFHTTALMPLVADMAPLALRGRYMATMGLSWWIGLALAPLVGTRMLALSPVLPLLVAAGAAVGAGVSAIGLGRRLPEGITLTPRADG